MIGGPGHRWAPPDARCKLRDARCKLRDVLCKLRDESSEGVPRGPSGGKLLNAPANSSGVHCSRANSSQTIQPRSRASPYLQQASPHIQQDNPYIEQAIPDLEQASPDHARTPHT